MLASGSVVEDHDPFEMPEPRSTSSAAVGQRLEAMVTRAGDNGLDPEVLPMLRGLLLGFEDVFCIELGNDPSANVESLQNDIQDGAKTFQTRPRRYAPAQSSFLRMHTQQQFDMGLIRRNHQSHWVCAAVPVPKAGRQLEFR
ncbi:hypothetical protein PI125_g1344 [Phytophthora idaei]|nr:hypothetical protein PI125_g1344 [Phytophthora idaei]